VRRELDRLVPLPVRAAALMPAAVLAVHQLRFQLAFGSHAGGKLASEGHQYLGALMPLAAMLVAIAAGLFLASLTRAWRRGGGSGSGEGANAPLVRVGLLAAATLLVIYCGQESLEGLLSAGHPEGIAGIFGEGGIWALPLSLALGFLVALCLRVAEVAIRWAAARRAPGGARRSPAPRVPRPADALLAAIEPLAGAGAGRAPPRPSLLGS
jgi:hypothetical protein